VLAAAIASHGESMTRGLANLLGDMHKGRISQSDESAFEVGRNLGVTPGEVVFENELIQLIQYRPATKEVAARPLVMVPPCINKFYILDLQPENSFVAHAVSQGNTVFMVSWRNVGPEQGHLTWDDYLEKGVLTALRVAREISASDKVNALGFCVGGTLLGSFFAKENPDWVASVTLLATMLDFSDTGQIGLFVDEAMVATREASIGKGGIFPGAELAFVFSSLRANDLVWPYVVNNYLLGGKPAAFDLLYWNSDSTNLPGPMYCHYLRNTYLENKLKGQGNFGRLDMPLFVVATREDHIVPWRTAYRSLRLFNGEKTFVLGASGHIAGIVNPPQKKRRSHWLFDRFPENPDAALAAATEIKGSWWPRWSEWLAQHSGGGRPAPAKPGNAKYQPIEQAPGRYVKQKA
jgi:polyhydroxyalkanoate synthase